MSARIGCLSYVPLGYGTPQLRYLVDSLAAHFGARERPGFFVPVWGRERLDALYPQYSIQADPGAVRQRPLLGEAVPRVVETCRRLGFERVAFYGAGSHTLRLLGAWRDAGGPTVAGIVVTRPTGADQTVEGLPVRAVEQIADLDAHVVVLSSELYEAAMASSLAHWAPLGARIALYEPRLTWLGASAERSDYDRLDPPLGPVSNSAGADWIDATRPDVLVCSHFQMLQAVACARHKPDILLYYALETPVQNSTDGTVVRAADMEAHRVVKRRITLCVYPEAARRQRHEEIFGLADRPAVTVYNTHPLREFAPSPAEARNGRILLQGTLRAGRTYVEYLRQVADLPVPFDLYGEVASDEATREMLSEESARRSGNYCYRGQVGSRELAQLRAGYSHVLVMWSPSSFDGLHACPNKFFEGIASGVPPIAAPHPQCREVIEQYRCGVLLDDWSLPAFRRGIARAATIRSTAEYRQLVANCAAAHEEICWERQFEKIALLLPRTPHGIA